MIRICDGARTEVEDLERVLQLFDELLETHADIAMISTAPDARRVDPAPRSRI